MPLDVEKTELSGTEENCSIGTEKVMSSSEPNDDSSLQETKKVTVNKKKRHVIATKNVRKTNSMKNKKTDNHENLSVEVSDGNNEFTPASENLKTSVEVADADEPPVNEVNDIEPFVKLPSKNEDPLDTTDNISVVNSNNQPDEGANCEAVQRNSLIELKKENLNENLSSNEAETKSTGNTEKDKKETKKQKTSKKTKEKAPKKKIVKVQVKSHVLTDYFPVRRSSRKPKSLIQKEEDDLIIESIHSKCEDGLSVVEFEGKGRGVVAKRAFKKGSFIVEYAGELIDWPRAKKREIEYAKDTSIGCYMYYFIFNNINYCVDATSESGRLGRLLNHSRKNPNCKTKLIGLPNPYERGTLPRLVIVAKRDISAGEELMYDYGDRDKETLESHPWLKST